MENWVYNIYNLYWIKFGTIGKIIGIGWLYTRCLLVKYGTIGIIYLHDKEPYFTMRIYLHGIHGTGIFTYMKIVAF